MHAFMLIPFKKEHPVLHRTLGRVGACRRGQWARAGGSVTSMLIWGCIEEQSKSRRACILL